MSVTDSGKVISYIGKKEGGILYTNHLITEKSPYLLQHAHNPVDWYPWSKEAFEMAVTRQKPIFLSIGYSTCHWCHVMEQESFEDAAVAEILNRDYIAVKVDREERPDVDGIYMDVCQMMTGSGGWPLTILMTPEQKPFFAGTYFPKEDRYGRIGLLSLLTQVAEKWKLDRAQLYGIAEDVTKELRRQGDGGFDRSAQRENGIKNCIARGIRQLTQMFDPRNGGFSGAPKFPVPHNLLFLMKACEYGCLDGAGRPEKAVQSGDRDVSTMADLTLRQMYRGGIFDHIGGGFSRYSTDERWLIPHFEKMLYDNALLALTYLEAYRITGSKLYREVAERTLAYMARELTHPKGGFFCGQDADSEGVEGKYYVFTPREIRQVLGEEEGKRFCRRYDITEEGNFEGRSIPNLLENDQYDTCHDGPLLLDYRRQRTTLHRDDKILTSWNGLAIWAFARAFLITGNVSYYKQAKKAASFVQANLMTLNGRLRVRWREGEAAHEGNLDDYAFYGMGLYELYQCDFATGWLRSCLRLTEKLLELFEDKAGGGFFFTGTMGEALIYRKKETYDGALPSGNSVAGLLLLRLSRLTGEQKWREAAKRQLSFLLSEMKGQEASHTMALLALTEQAEAGVHLVCTTDWEIPEEELRCYRKNQRTPVYALVVTPENQRSLSRLVPQAAEYVLQPGKTLYYVCKGEQCRPPVEELGRE